VRQGARVALLDMDAAALDAAVAELKAAGGEALAVQASVTDADAVERAFAQVEQAWGGIDVLVNNAGISANKPTLEVTVDEWRRAVDINLTGVFLCARAAFGLMRRQSPQGGRIINNGSISAHTPRPYTAPYTASKHAVTGLTKALSLDGRAFNIVASQIDIGNALTELSERMTRGVLQANGTTAPEPMMDATHVANAVRHMAALPLDANVLTMTIMASAMPFTGRG